jgi:hypothetical protein
MVSASQHPIVLAKHTRIIGCLLASCTFMGCTAPGLYTSAFPHQGSVQTTFVVEPVSWLLAAPAQNRERNQQGVGDVHLRLRIALPASCDMGLMFGLIRAGADVKCTVWQEELQAIAVDVGTLAAALDPSSTKGSVWLNTAALYSIRHPTGFAATLNAGFSYWARTDDRYGLEFLNASSLDARGPYLRAGFSIETPGWFSLQPEFNVFQQVLAGDRLAFVTLGVGFHLNHPKIRQASELLQVRSQGTD